MPRQFRTARLIKGLTVSDAIQLLGISQPTLSAWEGERKSPSLEKLELMAEVYGVSTDYLLGHTETSNALPSDSVAVENLPILHDKPVWSPKYGWMLVNSIEQCFLQPDGNTIPFSDADELYMAPPAYSETHLPQDPPLTLSELPLQESIWVEPVSKDPELRKELRGWYHPKGRFVENEYGNRFYMDTYGAKWLGFKAIEPYKPPFNQPDLTSIKDPHDKRIIFMDLLCDIADLLGVGPKHFLEHQAIRLQTAEETQDDPEQENNEN